MVTDPLEVLDGAKGLLGVLVEYTEEGDYYKATEIDTEKDNVTFPYRKVYILDNKLEFSGIKLAESYGFRYSNFKVNSQVMQVSLWCFKFKPFGYFRLQWYWLYPHDGTGSPSWRRKQPMCLFKG